MHGLLSVGDRVWYVISGLGNVPPIWVAAVVQRATGPRIGVRVSGTDRRVRYVSQSRLTTDAPPPGVTTLGTFLAPDPLTGQWIQAEWNSPTKSENPGPELSPETADLHGPELSPAAGDLHAAQEAPQGGYATTAWKGEGGPVPALAHVFAKNVRKHQ